VPYGRANPTAPIHTFDNTSKVSRPELTPRCSSLDSRTHACARREQARSRRVASAVVIILALLTVAGSATKTHAANPVIDPRLTQINYFAVHHGQLLDGGGRSPLDTRPSFTWQTWSNPSIIRWSWVTQMTALPLSRAIWRNKAITLLPRSVSSCAVGSSARTTCGGVGESASDGDTLLFAPGEVFGQMALALADTEIVEQLLSDRHCGPTLAAVDFQGDEHVLARGEERDEVVGLEDEAEMFPAEPAQITYLPAVVVDGDPADGDTPARRLDDAGNGRQQRRLTGATGPKNGQ
jgi:hypothetical protein